MKRRLNKQKFILLAVLFFLAIALVFLSTIILQNQNITKVGKSLFPVQINEVMSSNESYPNHDGIIADLIEFYNASDYAIDLTGYKLTDNNQKVRYTFPMGSEIEAQGYLVVYCKKNGEPPLADFSIAKAGGESIILMTARNVAVDSVEMVALHSDEAYTKSLDGNWRVETYGTPGYENSAEGYEQYLSSRKIASGTVLINEVMSSNNAYPDANGEYYDWVELYNNGANDITLSGYHLTDRVNNTGYQFPDGTVLSGGEYLVVYCDGVGKQVGFAPFAISGRTGEQILITDESGKVVDDVMVPALESNTSYARSSENQYEVSNAPTPGFENSETGLMSYLHSILRSANIAITEVMALNRSTLMDSDGEFSDWIELANYSDQAVELVGYFLSDRSEDSHRWAVPKLHLEPNERIVIFCSGKDKKYANELHTDFALDGQGETVSLFDAQGNLISSLSYPKISEDQSFCVDEDGGSSYATGYATPGFPNTMEGYNAFESSLEMPETLAINEAMSGNRVVWRQSNGEYYDWIEFINLSDQVINMGEFYVTDRTEDPKKCKLPDRRIAPGDVMAIACTGDSMIDELTNIQIALSLGSKYDTIYLTDQSGTVIDYMRLNALSLNGSYGRSTDSNGFFYFSQPTPNEQNRDGYRTISTTPNVSEDGGVFDQSSLEISLTGEGTIHYTLDGSIPTEDSPVYNRPLMMDKTTVLRAVSISQSALPSRILTNTYFLKPEHELPIVSLTVDPEEMFGRDGITAPQNRYDRSLEKTAHVEYYFGGTGFATDCGIQLHGDMSRIKSGRNKRSYKLIFREQYGDSPINFSIFENSGETKLYSIVLRNGSDALQSVIKDELVTNIAARTSPQLCIMDSRYCALYINGEYEGLYPIREGLSSGYYAVRYRVSKESVEMHRPDIDENKDFQALLSFARNNDLTIEENYLYMESRISFDSMIDWLIYEAYTSNSDVEGNVRYYKSSEGDAKWRYALFDLDFGMKEEASFQYLLTGSWNIIPRRLLKNEAFLNRFLTRMAYLLEKDLSQAAVLKEFDYLTNLLRPELERDRARWIRPQDKSYELYFDKLKNVILMDRTQQMIDSLSEELHIPVSQIMKYFGK